MSKRDIALLSFVLLSLLIACSIGYHVTQKDEAKATKLVESCFIITTCVDGAKPRCTDKRECQMVTVKR